MSRPQDPRPLFNFGNPFKMLSPKGYQLSPRFVSLLNSFEETLAERFRKLNPKDKNDVLTLAWMESVMESLCQTHTDVKSLITDLELPTSVWDEKWIDVYLDISVKLLDICNAFSSELTRLNQGHILLRCSLHKLESKHPEQFPKARSSLDSWRQCITPTSRVENCHAILDSLVESLDLPKVKNSAKGKILMRALYGVKVETVFVCSVLAAAFAGSAKNLVDLELPNTMLWAQAYSDLQSNVNGEIRNLFTHGKFTVIKELNAVDSCVKKLSPFIRDGLGQEEVEAFSSSFVDLNMAAGKLSQGVDLLAKNVDIFFKIVLTGRNALLGDLRASGTCIHQPPRTNVHEQVVM